MLSRDILQILIELSHFPNSFLVGGGVRDLLLGRKLKDLDFLLPNLDQVLKSVASFKSFTKVILNDKNGHFCYRFVFSQDTADINSADPGFKHADDRFWLDLVEFQSDNLINELAKRDFTINAIALPLKPLIMYFRDDILFSELKENIIDPYRGTRDLENRMLRAVSKTIFQDDPLRLWRMWRFAAELGFIPTIELIELASDNIDLCSHISGERIRGELFALLQQPDSAEYIISAANTGLLENQFPALSSLKHCFQDKHHYQDVWDHSFQALKELENILCNLSDYFTEGVYRNTIEEWLAIRNNLAILKLSALFHDIGKPQVKVRSADGRVHFYNHEKAGLPKIDAISDRLRLSRKDSDLLLFLVSRHLQIHRIIKGATWRTKARFWKNHGKDVIGLILLASADLLAKRKTSCLANEIESYFATYIPEVFGIWLSKIKDHNRIKPLLDGWEIMDTFGLLTGKQVGFIKEAVLIAQLEGTITTKSEAVKYAASLLDKRD